MRGCTQSLLLKDNIITICLDEVVTKHQYYKSCLVRYAFYILGTNDELLSHNHTNINSWYDSPTVLSRRLVEAASFCDIITYVLEGQ